MPIKPPASSLFARSVEWTKTLAKRKSATYWLCFLSFIESSFFPLPADLIFIPMVAAEKARTYFYAFIASISSVLGTILGWAIGRFFFEAIALPILKFYGKTDIFFAMQNAHSIEMVMILLLSAGFCHIPPIKIFTVLAGTINMPLGLFLLSSVVTRFARFYLLGWLVKNYSEQIVAFIVNRMKWIIGGACIFFILLYILYYLYS